jgi:hypothetical protein
MPNFGRVANRVRSLNRNKVAIVVVKVPIHPSVAGRSGLGMQTCHIASGC